MGRGREQGRGSPEGLAADLPALDFIHSGAGPVGLLASHLFLQVELPCWWVAGYKLLQRVCGAEG